MKKNDYYTVREIELVYKAEKKTLFGLGDPETVFEFMKADFKGALKEKFYAVFMNTKNEVLGYTLVSLGTVNEASVHPRDVFIGAIAVNAVNVIMLHNHPSGALKPSKEDINLTNRMRECGKLLGIPVLDHIIVSDESYFSMRENGFME